MNFISAGKHKSLLTSYIILISAVAAGFISFSIPGCGDDNCNSCELTDAERAFIPYVPGSVQVFENDSTGLTDTLSNSDMADQLVFCSGACGDLPAERNGTLMFTHMAKCFLSIHHGEPVVASFPGKIFTLTGPFTYLDINNQKYYDVLTSTLDSSGFTLPEKKTIPYKVYYSKSTGFVRLSMSDGSSWNRK